MSHYHVKVEYDDGWYVGRVLERPGLTTQGRTLDELVEMIHDAVALLWKERGVTLELVLPAKSRSMKKRARRRAA